MWDHPNLEDDTRVGVGGRYSIIEVSEKRGRLGGCRRNRSDAEESLDGLAHSNPANPATIH